jgi:hypothetical protein
LTGLVFGFLGFFLFGFSLGAVHAQQPASDISKTMTPDSNCPLGKFDANYGKCKG